MKYIAAVLLALALATSASAKIKYPWTVETPAYTARISKPIGMIPMEAPLSPELLQRSNESFFGSMADAGCPLFRRMRNEQGATMWFQVRLEGLRRDSTYDGALSGLVLTTKSGARYPVRQLLASKILRAVDPARIRLLVLTNGVPYEEFRSEKADGEAWIVFAGFDRAYSTDEIKSISLEGGTR